MKMPYISGDFVLNVALVLNILGALTAFPEKPEKMLDFSKKCGIVKETIPHNPGLRF